MSGYKPKSLDELNSMYDKALSAQRAIKRGTSKIDETTSSDSFFDDVIKEAELTVSKEPEKRIADLSVAVDDFIKHFSEPESKKVETPSAHSVAERAKTREPVKAPEIKAEKKASTIIATPSPAIARKQSGEHISSLMSDYIKIMNDQDDSDDEPRHRKSFLSRKKEKKPAVKESFAEEVKSEEEIFQEPEYIPLTDEMEEEVFASKEESAPSAASEEAFNAFSAMSKKKETFYKETVTVKEEVDESSATDSEESFPEEIIEDTAETSDKLTEEVSEEQTRDFSDLEEETENDLDDTADNSENEDSDEDEEKNFDELSSYSEEAEENEDSNDEDDEDDGEVDEEEFESDVPSHSKAKNTVRIISRVFLSMICVLTVLSSLFAASLSTVFNVNTGKEVFGKYYFFTSSHDFFASGVKAGDLVVCEKKTAVSDDETAVYIDLENKTFSFGVKDGSITGDNGDILYLIDGNEVDREDVLGTIYETVPVLGDIVVIIYEHYFALIITLVSVSAILLFIIIFALRRKKAEAEDEYDDEFEETEEEPETEEDSSSSEKEDNSEEDFNTDIFAELD